MGSHRRRASEAPDQSRRWPMRRTGGDRINDDDQGEPHATLSAAACTSERWCRPRHLPLRDRSVDYRFRQSTERQTVPFGPRLDLTDDFVGGPTDPQPVVGHPAFTFGHSKSPSLNARNSCRSTSVRWALSSGPYSIRTDWGHVARSRPWRAVELRGYPVDNGTANATTPPGRNRGRCLAQSPSGVTDRSAPGRDNMRNSGGRLPDRSPNRSAPPLSGTVCGAAPLRTPRSDA